jgi:glycosyltransferase involved in cell wall biosynthesis
MPLVSVIMPSYNHERFISESIESVLNQSMADLELIIIDDASSDQSGQVIESYARTDDRIKTVFHEKNMGIARTVNDGIERATGKFIAFTASDDLWVKEKLKKQVKVLEENDNLVVWSEGEVIDDRGIPTGELYTEKYFGQGKTKSGDIFEDLLWASFIFGSSLILTRDNLGDIRFNPAFKYLNDYQFAADLAREYHYCFVPENLAKYRRHGANTGTDNKGYLADIVLIRNYHLETYGSELSPGLKTHMYLNMAQAYTGLGNKLQAEECLHSCRCVLDRHGDGIPDALKSATYLEMATSYLNLGSRLRAEECLCSCKRLLHSHGEISRQARSDLYLQMVPAYLRIGRRGDAVKCLYRSIAAKPSVVFLVLSPTGWKRSLGVLRTLQRSTLSVEASRNCLSR